MGIVGSYQYPTMESVIYGKPAAEALREEAERLAAKRVFLIVSRTLNTATDEIEKIRKALGDRHAETFDRVPQHTTREVVVRVAKQARDAKSDLVVAIGGGSVVDAAKIVLMCMEHEILIAFDRPAKHSSPTCSKATTTDRVHTSRDGDGAACWCSAESTCAWF